MNSPLERIYTKNGKIAQQIARQLIGLPIGSRLPRIDDFVNALRTARGTVQGALKLLEESGAVQLDPRGHLGTFLTNKDQTLLWEIAGRNALVGVMPLPYSRRYEGLATGLVESFQLMNIPFHIAHMRGAHRRIEAVRNRRFDFAIVSRWAAEKTCQESIDLSVLQAFGEKTYVNRHGILFADQSEDRIRPGMRVGIDPSSPDQSDLTRAECRGLDIQWIEVNYMQLFPQLENGEIDAAVWNLDEIPPTSKWGLGTFRSESAQSMSRLLSEATLLTRRPGEEVWAILKELPLKPIIQTQQSVLEGKTLPHY
ncbi:GntR family transcriptional regulator YhfZ [Paludifilum halophilum]|uniref:HTH gntR-type domain-containing protein n=1 Tax=Paludifilum halophilum TaxID=1642702 RepID=A0A235B4B8_9BACL|nr:GntR family transcriptional regulator YhfZ [Paludifilum halophilum]OYD06809.1 hypothetical protein CHM34_14750 [Paludifilum halophilum]